MTTGHVMLDLQELNLLQLEREILQHPQVGGVILFARNYESKKQLRHLTQSIRKLMPDGLIAVDQEGGRVQRFKNGFLLLPSFRAYGELYEKNNEDGLLQAEKVAYEMAKELIEVGLDLSFTPVLDIDTGESEIIGDRSFHQNIAIITELGNAFIKGMHRAGMPATGKHFPGHGSVTADSHLTLPIDSRCYEEIFRLDMQPFIKLKHTLDAVMPAHILYENVDAFPTCFSHVWLQEILRKKIGFSGVIFSDDLSMVGAEFISDYTERARAAFAAGCDMILVCNQGQAIRVLDDLETYKNPLSANRLANLRKKY